MTEAKDADGDDLAEPVVCELTDPPAVKSLRGQNNVWSDAGDVALEYCADVQLYLQRLTQPDDDMTADANIAAGTYFMVGNRLYRSTASIAAGETVSPGTNCTALSLADALNAINS